MNDLFKRRLTIILGLLFIVGSIGTCKVLKDSKKTPDRMEVIAHTSTCCAHGDRTERACALEHSHHGSATRRGPRADARAEVIWYFALTRWEVGFAR
ncbi:MAG: hypothetical protein IPF64_18015 [Flavobacteriales bacterium]|nr:hypothetical protein [Flavobacteriales bacterium]